MNWSVRQDAAWLAAVVASAMMLEMSCSTWSPLSARHPLLGKRVERPAEADPGQSSAAAPRCTVLLLWSPWCSACKKWLSLLDRLQRQAGSTSVVAIAAYGNREDVDRVLREYDISIPQVHDPDGAWLWTLKVEVIPRILVIDRSGHLIYASPDDADTAVIEGVFWHCAAESAEAACRRYSPVLQDCPSYHYCSSSKKS